MELYLAAILKYLGFRRGVLSGVQRIAAQDLDANLKEHILAIHQIRPHFGYIRMKTALARKVSSLITRRYAD